MVNAYFLYKIMNWFYRKKIPLIPKLIKLVCFILYNSSIPYECELGKGTRFGYGGIGVVLHKRVIIGNNCMIGSNVTVGGKSGHYEVPVIGNHVYLATGSKILGPISIGNNVSVGANAVVIKSVPDNAIVAGVPARNIKKT